MKMIILLLLGICLVTVVSAFPITTNTYSVDKTNTGLAGSKLDTNTMTGRMYWEPWQPATNAETTLYFLNPGYFETITGLSQSTSITLLSPPDNTITNDQNITFSHTATSNGTIESCNLLAWYNNTLTINDTITYPGQGTHNWTGYPLPENTYTWRVECTSGGNKSSSQTNNLIIDRTAPVVMINEPLNDTTPWETFNFTINEPHPTNIDITVNGTTYTFNYTNGTNMYQPNLPEGILNWSITAYDAAGNNYTITSLNLYSINIPVTFENPQFSPNPPWNDIDNTLSDKISGTFTDVKLSINLNGTGWTNYTILTSTGSGPYNYYYELDQSNYDTGDWIAQQWYAKDNIGEWQPSSIANTTVKQRLAGHGGSMPPPTTESGTLAAGLKVTPQPLQITNMNGVLFDVENNGSQACTIKTISVEDRIGSNELQDAFTTKSLELQDNYTINPGERMAFQLKPRSFQGIVGVGAIIVTSDDCENATADLSVNIHWLDITIDAINKATNNIIRFVNEIVGAL